MPSEMMDTFSRKLTGLSSEQMNVFNLKKSLECSVGFWNQMIAGGLSSQLDNDQCDQLREKCSMATTTFRNVIKSAEQQKDAGNLQSFLSESVMTAYLRLTIVYYSAGVEDINDSAESEYILFVLAHCLKSMEASDNTEKLVADFTEGVIHLIAISIKYLQSSINENEIKQPNTMNAIRFATMYTSSLASMSRKHNNRKKLYTVFCNRLLGPALMIFQILKSSKAKSSGSKVRSAIILDFTHALEILIENSLFYDDKNVEDLATAVSSSLTFSTVAKAADSKDKQKETASFKASYHSGLFDSLTVVCSSIFGGTNSVSGYPDGIARLLQVYSKCSQRILSASLLNEQNHDSKHSGAVPTGKPSTTLLERRKHTIRLLQVSLALLTIVDIACQKSITSVLEKEEGGSEDDHRELSSFLLTCVKTQKEVLQSLSLAMDETGGYSILATHDSLQPFAKRLSVLCNRALKGAASPLQAYIPSSMSERFTARIHSATDDTQRAIGALLLETQSNEFDSVRILAGIDHRVITARPQSEISDPSPVLQAIAGSGVFSIGGSLAGSGSSQSQVLRSKEHLLLSVITLFNDLRMMDDFVSEVRGVCQSEAPSLSTFVSLLGSLRVQDSLSRAFAALPVSQTELVWESLTKLREASGTRGMEQRCQSMIVRALVRASTLSSSASRHHGSDGVYSCDDILQVGAQISLSTPLPKGIVDAMTSLFRESVTALQQLEERARSAEQFGFIFDIISMLLQLGSAAIVLRKGRSDSSDDWLAFRECAGAAAALVSIQRPVAVGGLTGGEGCLPAAVVLLSLSVFMATCDSLKLSVCKASASDEEGEERELLSSREIDGYVLELISTSCVRCAGGGDRAEGKVTDTAVKRKRKALEEPVTPPPPSSVLAIDFLLLFSRSVSIWRHLSVGSDVISALTAAHFKDMALCYSALSDLSGSQSLLVKHACLCRLMQLVTVQDCPVLVNGFLQAVESIVQACSDTLTAQTGDSSSASARKPKAKNVKGPIDLLTITAMRLVATSSANSSLSGMSVPVNDLLAASNAVLGDISNPSSGSLYMIANIAQHSSSVIAQLLPELSTKPTKDGARDDRRLALESAASVLLLCLQHRPTLRSAKPVAPAAGSKPPARTLTRGSKEVTPATSTRIGTESEIWDKVGQQLRDILMPLLSVLLTQGGDCIVSLHSLPPPVVDFLLHNNLSSDITNSDGTNKEDSNAHEVLTIIGDNLCVYLSEGKTSYSYSGFRTCVEMYRRTCSYYCALPGDVISSSGAIVTVKREVSRLMSKLNPFIDGGVSLVDTLAVDSCYFLAADSLRLYVKCTEDVVDDSDLFLTSISLPILPSAVCASIVVLDGWFLLTGTILLLQRRGGNLLTVQGSFALIDSMKRAVLLAASSPSADNTAVREETLISLTVCLQALVGSVPYAVRSAVGEMLSDLALLCACSSRGSENAPASSPTSTPASLVLSELSSELSTVSPAPSSVPSTPSSSGSSISSARLSRFVVLGVDCLLSAGGQYNNNFDVSGRETSSSLVSARAVLESVAVSCTGSADMLACPEVVLAVVSALRRGITAIQQQQQKGRRRLKRARTLDPDVPEISEVDREEGESSRGREHALSQWASCCFSVLSKIVPRLLRGGGIRSDKEERESSDRARVEIAAHCLSVLEQLFACDSVGGSSLPLLGNSIGTLGALLTTAIRVIVAADEKSCEEARRTSNSDIMGITNALRVAGRMLTAASSSKELNRHAHVLAASVVDLLAQRPVSMNTRELLLPGLFALFDRCRQKQRLQMFATVSAQTRAVLSDLHGTYLRDFKFTGQ